MKYNDKIIIKIRGRMANQMFEWALGRVIAKRTGIQPIFDDSQQTEKLSAFNTNFKKFAIEKSLKYKLCRLIPIRNLRNELTKIRIQVPELAEETHFKYDEKYINVQAPLYLNGYFQSYKYLDEVRDTLLEDFTLKKKLNSKNKKILEKIQQTESVSVHYRRTDYLKPRVAQTFGGCGEEYYKTAVDLISKKIDKPITLFIFSDDTKWVKQNVKFEHPTVIVDINSGKQGYFDLELMKNCKHNIIANSSFSYFGAWLNENKNKIVVAPKNWTATSTEDYDLIPPDWIRIN